MTDEVPMVHLEASKLGDPEYITHEVRASELRFRGDAADYVAGVLSEARAERTREEIIRQFVTFYAAPDLPALKLRPILDEFSVQLLNSSAVGK